VHDILIVASFLQYKKISVLNKKTCLNQKTAGVGEPAVFFALKRTYGKKERMVATRAIMQINTQ
jgi:hypothetical protein